MTRQEDAAARECRLREAVSPLHGSYPAPSQSLEPSADPEGPSSKAALTQTSLPDTFPRAVGKRSLICQSPQKGQK